jgi:hypothetical protein
MNEKPGTARVADPPADVGVTAGNSQGVADADVPKAQPLADMVAKCYSGRGRKVGPIPRSLERGPIEAKSSQSRRSHAHPYSTLLGAWPH